jgi:DNA repair protein RadC
MWLQRVLEFARGAPAPSSEPRAVPPDDSGTPNAQPRWQPRWQPRGGSAREEQRAFVPYAAKGQRARMRERLAERGAEGFAPTELLEMLLYAAYAREDTRHLAQTLVRRHGSVAAVIAAPAQELLQTPGVTQQAVTILKVVEALLPQMLQAEVRKQPLLDNWDKLLDYLHVSLARAKVEQFRVLFLDSRNRLIADEVQARGTVNQTPVFPREIARRALELDATAVVLVHNHPSGDPTPSQADIAVTAEVKAAVGALGIVLHDHVIVGNGAHASLAGLGLL